MAYFGIASKLLKGEKIQIFNYDNSKRDVMYVCDAVAGVKCVMMCTPEKKNDDEDLVIPPYVVYNIGNSNLENLLDCEQILSDKLV